MGNKTAVIQELYNRVSRLTSYGVKEVRVGSLEQVRKGNDLPVVWVGLEGGTEAGNFKNGASVDEMRVTLSILDNKLKLTNNTLFREGVNGSGDTYTLSNESAVGVGNTIPLLTWFNDTITRNLTTGPSNGAKLLTQYSTQSTQDPVSSTDLIFDGDGIITSNFLDFIGTLQVRPLTVGDATINVLCEGSVLPGFTYNGVELGTPVDLDFENNLLALLHNIKKHTLTITDFWGNVKGSFIIYTYNDTGVAVNGGTSGAMGEPEQGALIILEKALDTLDLDANGNPDITFSAVANNRRDISYTVDAFGDYVAIVATVTVESKIFLMGRRRG